MVTARTDQIFEDIIKTLREPLLVLNQDLRVVLASFSFYKFFKVKPEETVGRLIYDLGNKQWDIPKLRELLETILPQRTSFDNYEVEHDFATIGRRTMLLNARQIERETGEERIILLAIEDITERKRLEGLLTESEERYRRLFETANDGIVLLEQGEGKITHANPAIEKMLGYTREETIGNRLQDIGISLDLSDFQTTMQNLNKNGMLMYDDVPATTKAGEHIDMDIYLVDRARLVQCNIRDIATRKLVEKKLRESGEKYRLVVDNIADVIIVMDMNLRFTYVSPSIIRLRGYTTEETMAQTMEQIMTPESLQIITRVLEEEMQLEAGGAADPRRTRVMELEEYRKDGSTVWIENSLSYIRDTALKPVGIISLSRDITERKRAEEALRESEEKYRWLLDNMADVISVMDMNLRFTYVSPSIMRFRGYTAEEAVAQTFEQVMTPESLQISAKVFEEEMKLEASGTADPGRIRIVEVEQYRKDGSIVLMENHLSFLRDEAQKPVGIISVSRDITERRKLEAQLRHSQKMQAISSLAGGIAHDFNNILSAIMGYGQLAQMNLDPESEPYADLKEVLQSGNRAKLLIQQILAVGRDQEQERQPMQLKYIVREALNFLRSTLPSTIEIRETNDKEVGIIDADPTQMHQVLMNLCTNAGHAMEKNGGILEVSLRNVTVGPREQESGVHLEPGSYLRLTVSDTGYGIAQEIREKIFDPYFTTKEQGEGTGIGLSVVHGIVLQHGGDITVDSEPGKGSTFHVYLPLTQGEEEQPEVQEETPLPKGNERILFIDDEAALANMGKQMLIRLGYDVTSMTSSIEALALFRKDPKQFDLVITDTTMPHMPGDILAQEMMKIRPDIPVVISTGHSKRISPEKADEMGIKGFLMKPLAMRDVANIVRKVLDEK